LPAGRRRYVKRRDAGATALERGTLPEQRFP
jgi:hypothetical protein